MTGGRSGTRWKNRRFAIGVSGTLLLGLLGIVAAVTPPPAMAKARPNFVLIIGDDISVDDFGCYGHPHIRTPNVDRLAADGIRFTNAYLTTSQCSPTRCSVITGRYPHNTGAPELHMPLPAGQVMFPDLLQESGYYTAAAGKWHLGDYAMKAFDTVVGGVPGGEEHWIEVLRGRPKDKPFFLWFASNDAHRAWQADDEAQPHSPDDVVFPPFLIDTPAARIDMAQYYDEVQRLDRYVGLVVDELRRQKVLEDTCIIFMADNGRPFPRCKTRLYDSGIKTPFIVRLPGGDRRRGIVSNSLISAIDIAPTVLEMAGVAAPETVQGVSLMPVLEDPAAEIREYVFAEHNWHVQIAHERLVRHGNYVYIRNAHPQLPQICSIDAQCPQKELRAFAKQGNLTPAQADPLLTPRPAEELFDVERDPHQLSNLAEDPKHRETLERLRRVLNEWQSRTGDTTPELAKASKDRVDRRTSEAVPGRTNESVRGVIPGEAARAAEIRDPGPR